MLETARFWASRAAREDDGRYHIRGVIGPDEYHERVDDNAYTNGMAHWNLERGDARWRDLCGAVAGALGGAAERLGLTTHELGRMARRWPATSIPDSTSGQA